MLQYIEKSYEIMKEIVLGFPAMNLYQRVLTWFFMASAFLIVYLVVLPRSDCGIWKIQAACDWISRDYNRR